MTPYLQDRDFTLHVGDVMDVLPQLEPGSVDCVITSPPYWGLRDYGTGQWAGGDPDCDHLLSGGGHKRGLNSDGHNIKYETSVKAQRESCRKCGATRQDHQLGLEPTPDQYIHNIVNVFRQVWRVLAPHGTCWINLGDSYAGGAGGRGDVGREIPRPDGTTGAPSAKHDGKRISNVVPLGLKPKDLVGIPWAVAKALQEPYYTGRISAERDRVWLAATIDAEGSICGFTHERADGDGTRTGIHITITNTSMALLAEAQRIWPTSRNDGNGHGISALGTRECRRWIAHNVDDKAQLLAELYPYLIAKKQQALLAWNFLEMSKRSKRIGRLAEGAEAKGRRAWIVSALSNLNHGREVVFPDWLEEPEGMWERGWFLRSEIIWAKCIPNPMPESVTDRPTKSHEQVFLLSKQPRYWFDAEAVREPGEGRLDRGSNGSLGRIGKQRWTGTPLNEAAGRNIRSVWEIATQPYPEAHFATYPQELVRRALLAGCPEWVCRTCGKPRERIVETTRVVRVAGGSSPAHAGIKGYSASSAMVTNALPQTQTLGWSDCGHNNHRPGQVLDPFLGSGTTALVARHHNRRCVGIELSPAYAQLAAQRLQQLSLLAEIPA